MTVAAATALGRKTAEATEGLESLTAAVDKYGGVTKALADWQFVGLEWMLGGSTEIDKEVSAAAKAIGGVRAARSFFDKVSPLLQTQSHADMVKAQEAAQKFLAQNPAS
eukprot:10751609-Alexandrium_andersonii.AAC.1